MKSYHFIKNLSGKLISCFLIVVIIAGFIPAIAQTRRSTTRTAKPKTETSPSAKSNLPKLVSTTANSALLAAWNTGELPSALPAPQLNADETAAYLAKKVAAGDKESVSALLTALQLSGFFVTGKGGKTLLAPTDGKGQGLTVNGWEIASVSKMLGDGKTTKLSELQETLSFIPNLKKAKIADFVIAGLKQNSINEKDPFLRMWARFIIELGKNSANKYDLSGKISADQVTLDAVQNFLILRRIYGDIFAFAEKNKKVAELVRSTRKNTPRYVSAAYSPDVEFKTDYINAPEFDFKKKISGSANLSNQQVPCRMDGDAPIVMDAMATILGTGFGELTGYLGDTLDGTAGGDAIGKYAEIAGIANIILAYAKFLQTYAALETQITLEDAPPLIRTKNSVPGGRKKLKAVVKMNIGNWQIYNCLRTAINLAGIDFSTVNDGPISGVGVQWHLDEGGAGDVYSNRGGLTGKEQFVGFTQDGARIQDAGSSTGTTGNRIANATYTKTDDNGEVSIILEGSPQKNVKIGKLNEVMKKAKISTTVKMKAGDLKGESVDVAGQALGGITGLITMPLELLYRMDWISTAFLEVPVQDWEECSGGWSGTISYNYSFKDESSGSSDFMKRNFSGGFADEKSSRQITYQAQVNLDGNGQNGQQSSMTTGNGIFAAFSQKGTSSGSISELYEFSKKTGKKDGCGANDTRLMTNQTTTSKQSQASISGEVNVGLTMMNSTYNLNFSLPRAIGMTTGSTASKSEGFCNPRNNNSSSNAISETTYFEGRSFSIKNQTFDSKNPDRIQGSSTETSADGKSTVTVTWNLKRCR